MFYKKSESFEKNLYESSNSDEDDRYIVYCICEISFFNVISQQKMQNGVYQ